MRFIRRDNFPRDAIRDSINYCEKINALEARYTNLVQLSLTGFLHDGNGRYSEHINKLFEKFKFDADEQIRRLSQKASVKIFNFSFMRPSLKRLDMKMKKIFKKVHGNFMKVQDLGEISYSEKTEIMDQFKTYTYSSDKRTSVLDSNNQDSNIDQDKLGFHSVLQIMAHEFAYCDFSTASQIENRTADIFKIGDNEFKVDRIFINHKGLKAYGLINTSKLGEDGSPNKPILLIQGTNPKSITQVFEDVSGKSIGKDSVLESEKELKEWLQANNGAIVTGHSLGGAISQHVAALLPENVSEVITFNSPCISRGVIDKYWEVEEGKRPTVINYRTSGDIVPFANGRKGGYIGESRVVTLDVKPKSLKEKHSVLSMSSGKHIIHTFPSHQPKTKKAGILAFPKTMMKQLIKLVNFFFGFIKKEVEKINKLKNINQSTVPFKDLSKK